MAIMKDSLKEKYNYILKGVGPPEYHLGGNSGRDPDGTPHIGSSKLCRKDAEEFSASIWQPTKEVFCTIGQG